MKWTDTVAERFPGAEFYSPADERNPHPDMYSVVGPTSESACSPWSIEHAAMLFLGHFHDDHEARRAAGQLALKMSREAKKEPTDAEH